MRTENRYMCPVFSVYRDCKTCKWFKNFPYDTCEVLEQMKMSMGWNMDIKTLLREVLK